MNHLPPIAMHVRGSAYRLLMQEFLTDLALAACRERWSHIYVQIIAKLVRIHRVELCGPGDFATAMNREELLERVGERFGIKGREMFEKFVAQLERLRADAQGEAPQRGRSGG